MITIKALVLADLHTRDEKEVVRQEHFDECQFIITVGDLSDTKRNRPGAVIGPRQDFKFDLPVIGVFGNHENWREVKNKKHGVRDCHKKIIQYKGLKFAGVGGVIAQRPRRIYHNDKDDIIKWLKSLIEKKKKIDVFVMHEPPLGCFDVVRRKHRGVEEYRDLLIEIAPRYLFVAHMHTYRGRIDWTCGTTVINPGVGIRGEYVVLDFSKDKAIFCP